MPLDVALDLLARHGPALVTAVTLVLLAGLVASRGTRAVVAAQRAGEVALLAALLVVPLGLLPLPRPAWLDASGAWSAAVSACGLASSAADASPAPAVDAWRAPSAVGPTHDRGGPTTDAEVADTAPGSGRPSTDAGGADALRDLDAHVVRRASGRARGEGLALDAAGPGALRAGDSAHAPSPDAPASPRGWIARTLAGAYLLGVLLATAWLVSGVWRLARILREARPAPDDVRALLPSGATTRRVRVLVSPRAVAPFCVGWLRPVIVLPESLLRAPSRRVLRHVVLHEFGHVRQHDGRGRLLSACALTLLWFHPLAHLLRRRVRLLSELVADELAARSSSPSSYAADLLELAGSLPVRGVPLPASTVLRRRSDLSVRIPMLLHRDVPLSLRCSPARRLAHSLFGAGSLVLAFALLGAPPAVAQDASSAEIEALRAERDALQVQQDALRAEVEALHATLRELMAAVDPRAGGSHPDGPTTDALAPRSEGDPITEGSLRQLRELSYLEPPGTVDQPVGDDDPSHSGLHLLDSLYRQPPQGDSGSAPPEQRSTSRTDMPVVDPSAGYGSGAGALLDAASLLDLVNQAIDLEVELEQATSELARQGPLVERGLVSQEEHDRAVRQHHATERKLAAVRVLLRGEFEATQFEADPYTGRDDLDGSELATLRRLEARLEILRSAL